MCTIPTHYISVRVTVPHEKWDDVDALLHDYEQYVAYPHTGKTTDKQHFHIFIPATDTKECEKLRTRFKRHFKQQGNGFISIKFMSNGILNSITYGSREGTAAYVKGADAPQWVEAAPEWVNHERNLGASFESRQYRAPKEDHFKILNYRNLEKATLKYRQAKGITSTNLEDTLEKMHADGWRLDRQCLTQGIPATMYDQFTAQCGGTTVYTAGRFARMRRVEHWVHNI